MDVQDVGRGEIGIQGSDDHQDSYDAMTIRRDPHERVSYSSSRQRILGK